MKSAGLALSASVRAKYSLRIQSFNKKLLAQKDLCYFMQGIIDINISCFSALLGFMGMYARGKFTDRGKETYGRNLNEYAEYRRELQSFCHFVDKGALLKSPLVVAVIKKEKDFHPKDAGRYEARIERLDLAKMKGAVQMYLGLTEWSFRELVKIGEV